MTAWNPGRLGALLAAWEADFGITLNGGTVASWTAKYGSGVLAQGTTASQPTFTANRGDGKPEVTFDGVNDSLSLDSLWSQLPDSAHAVVLSGKLTSTVAGGRLVQVYVAGDETNQKLLVATTNNSGSCVIEAGCRVAGAWNVTSSAAVPSAATLRFTALVQRNGSVWTISANGTTQNGTQAASSSGSNTMIVGAGSGTFFGGTLSALWVFSGPVDVAATIAAMQAKFPNL